jgi:polysaccharide pyruvyl transferase WcaK-like protein
VNVVLLSNYRTRNLGNLTLTRVVQRLLADRFGPEHLIALHRLPHPLADLASRGDLDQWVPALASIIGPLDDLPGPAPSAFGERAPDLAAATRERTPSGPRQVTTRMAHTALGTRLRARLDRDAGRAHVGALLAGSDVVWNPGGELNTLSTPTSRLLDTAVALDRGRRMSMVNFSLETTPGSLAFLRRRAPRLHTVIGRDERTTAAFVDLGLDADRVRLSPDAVFLTGSSVLPEVAVPRAATRREAVGIVLHGATAIDPAPWRRVVDAARRDGAQIEVLSSHKTVDGAVIDQLMTAVGPDRVTILPEFTDVVSYLAHLSTLRAVVTARLHTAILALLTGITVVGVDTYGTKVAGALTTAGFSGAVASGADWADAATAIIERGPIADDARIDEVRKRILAVWDRAFVPPVGPA